jgi:ABC-type sugar transport system ATPase subunit
MPSLFDGTPADPSAARGPIVLAAEGLTKVFAGNVVLDSVDLALRAGEVHAIVGENGAGKSTLIKLLGGVYRPDGGRLSLDDRELRLAGPREAIAAGIVSIHQELSLAPHLSAEENIFLGHFPRTVLGTVDRGTMRRRTGDLLERLAIRIDQRRPVGELSIAQQQMVEIAKAISLDARVLILDEPTAVLDETMVVTLFDLVRRLRSEGLAVVFISHHLEEIFEIADRVTVLRDGRRTGEAAVRDVNHDWLVSHMIGRTFEAHAARDRRSGEPVLEVKGLAVSGVFDDVSFAIGAGEIVGLAGLVGAGRTEVAETVVGVRRKTAGTVRIRGVPVEIANPNAAARHGIAYVTEDRKALGLLANRPVRENATIANLSRFRRFGFLRLGRERGYVAELIRRLDVRLAGMEVEIRTLSGGNQQKVLIGRALSLEPKILIFDEPTRGVDIGAKREIYALIENLVANGTAVLLISSELEEILRLCDRVIVLRGGRVAATLTRDEASEETVMRAAALAEPLEPAVRP